MSRSVHPLRNLLAVAALIACQSGVMAADNTPSPSPAADRLAPARALIQQDKWLAAIDELRRLDDRHSADWNNLMGYSHRKAKVPDYAAAERYYDEALRIDPSHKGALEYSGELYLMLNQLPKAEQRLAALDKLCLLPCEEFTDLKAAIARYKGNGNTYSAK